MNKIRVFIFSLCFIYGHAYTLKPYSFHISYASLSNVAREVVYDSSHKVSELIWQSDCVNLIGIDLIYSLKPNLFLSLNYQKNLVKQVSLLDDYDWLKDGISDWSHWSHHENTYLTDVNIIDVKLTYKELIKYFDFGISFLYDSKLWKAYDGIYVYSSSSGFRDEIGSFNGLMISYKQVYLSANIFLKYTKKIADFSMGVFVSYAPYVAAFDYDTHHLRNIQFDSTFGDITSIRYQIFIKYNYSEKTFVGLKYESIDYTEGSGNTHYTNLNTGYEIDYAGAGMSSRSQLYSITIGYQF